MFEQFPFRCCKDYMCNCCLNEEEITDKLISKQIKQMRARTLYEGKLILLGEYQHFM